MTIFSSGNGHEIRAFDPNVCDCVDWHQGLIDPENRQPIMTCPPLYVSLWRNRAVPNGTISRTGRCAYTRHGFGLNIVGAELRIDFLNCHDQGRNDLLSMRRVVDCTIDTAFASSAGWGDLLSPKTTNILFDEQNLGVVACKNQSCGMRRLPSLGLHLRAIEKKQMLRAQEEENSNGIETANQ